jgi:hypothetical protein
MGQLPLTGGGSAAGERRQNVHGGPGGQGRARPTRLPIDQHRTGSYYIGKGWPGPELFLDLTERGRGESL